MLNKKLNTLKYHASINLLLDIGQEYAGLDKFKKLDTRELEAMFEEIKKEGFLLDFFNIGLERIYTNYASLGSSYFEYKEDEREFKKNKDKVYKKNGSLTLFLQKMVQDNSFTISMAQELPFFQEKVINGTLLYEVKSHSIPSLIDSLIDIFASSSVAQKTSFFNKAFKSYLSGIYSDEILLYIENQENTQRFKNNFNFSKDFFSQIIKSNAASDMPTPLSKDDFEKDFQKMLSYSLDIKTILPAYLDERIETHNNPVEINRNNTPIEFDIDPDYFNDGLENVVSILSSSNKALSLIVDKIELYNVPLLPPLKQKLVNMSAHTIGVFLFLIKESFEHSSIINKFNQDKLEKSFTALSLALADLEKIEARLGIKSDKKTLLKKFPPSWTTSKVMDFLLNTFLDNAHNQDYDEYASTYQKKKATVINFLETFLEKITLENSIVSKKPSRAALLKI